MTGRNLGNAGMGFGEFPHSHIPQDNNAGAAGFQGLVLRSEYNERRKRLLSKTLDSRSTSLSYPRDLGAGSYHLYNLQTTTPRPRIITTYLHLKYEYGQARV